MTLNEWSLENNAGLTAFQGAYVAHDIDYPNRSGLWQLTDYFVSSVSCGSIWLLPKEVK